MGFSPALLDSFALQMKNALALSENVPEYVKKSAEDFRQSIRLWSQELKDNAASDAAKKVGGGAA